MRISKFRLAGQGGKWQRKLPYEHQPREFILPGALTLMGSVMLRVTFGDQAWQKYESSGISDLTFRTAAKFYHDGHRDHVWEGLKRNPSDAWGVGVE